MVVLLDNGDNNSSDNGDSCNQAFLKTKVRELEEESWQKKDEEVEEGALATILGSMKRTISNADGLRYIRIKSNWYNSTTVFPAPLLIFFCVGPAVFLAQAIIAPISLLTGD